MMEGIRGLKINTYELYHKYYHIGHTKTLFLSTHFHPRFTSLLFRIFEFVNYPLN